MKRNLCRHGTPYSEDCYICEEMSPTDGGYKWFSPWHAVFIIVYIAAAYLVLSWTMPPFAEWLRSM